jgi:hypothetical protein
MNNTASNNGLKLTAHRRGQTGCGAPQLNPVLCRPPVIEIPVTAATGVSCQRRAASSAPRPFRRPPRN